MAYDYDYDLLPVKAVIVIVNGHSKQYIKLIINVLNIMFPVKHRKKDVF